MICKSVDEKRKVELPNRVIPLLIASNKENAGDPLMLKKRSSVLFVSCLMFVFGGRICNHRYPSSN